MLIMCILILGFGFFAGVYILGLFTIYRLTGGNLNFFQWFEEMTKVGKI